MKGVTMFTKDGKVFAGRTARETVKRMIRESVFTVGKSPADYMQSVANRIARLDGVTIRHNNAPTFLRDLAQNDYITLLGAN